MKVFKIDVTLEGLSDIMFDRFIDHSKDKRPPEQKFYLVEGNQLVIPAENLWSFYTRQKHPVGCIKKCEQRTAGNFLSYFESHASIHPTILPFTRGEQSIIFDGFNGESTDIVKSEIDKKSKKIKHGSSFYVHRGNPVNKLSGGGIIKMETIERPVLLLPWQTSFCLSLIENEMIDDTKLLNWTAKGGLLVALGAYKPRFGRFMVTQWDVTVEEKEHRGIVAIA